MTSLAHSWLKRRGGGRERGLHNGRVALALEGHLFDPRKRGGSSQLLSGAQEDSHGGCVELWLVWGTCV
jgi:hypothetical protein